MRRIRWSVRVVGRLGLVVICLVLGMTTYGLLGLLIAAGLMLSCGARCRVHQS
jgi:hypothetical protein